LIDWHVFYNLQKEKRMAIAPFETGIVRVDLESRRMTSVAIVMSLNILMG
jgi:hypothetical protein